MSNTLSNIQTIAPIGGFGNHLRWLLFLSLPGPITISASCLPNYPLDYSITLTDNADVLNFIKTEIYHPKRTWDNWLFTEWTWRINAGNYIAFSHELDDINKNTEYKTIILTSSPELCLKSYFKFNSSLNIRTSNIFKNDTDLFNIKARSFAQHPNVMILDASISLFQPTLDQALYNQIVDFTGLPNYYQEANEIHTLWYNLHRQAEREFVTYVNQLYK